MGTLPALAETATELDAVPMVPVAAIPHAVVVGLVEVVMEGAAVVAVLVGVVVAVAAEGAAAAGTTVVAEVAVAVVVPAAVVAITGAVVVDAEGRPPPSQPHVVLPDPHHSCFKACAKLDVNPHEKRSSRATLASNTMTVLLYTVVQLITVK